MIILKTEGLYKSFDRGKTHILKDVHLTLEKGKIYALIGDSGSGKTTLFRLISGLDTVDAGSVWIKNRLVSNETTIVPPYQRDIGMVFQDLALFPHLNVYRNIRFGLKHDDEQKVSEMLSMVDLKGFENRYPDQLSVGQQQRVAIARALITSPDILLLDEPFSNLDERLKSTFRNKLTFIVKQLGITMFFITHDVHDALAISDEAMFLHKGALLEKGPLKVIFKNSTSDYVLSVRENLSKSAQCILSAIDLEHKTQE